MAYAYSMKSPGCRALVVSNNPLHSGALEFELAKAGFRVTVVSDAEQGFQATEKQPYDLVVSDFKTPHGTGVDLARRLRHCEQYGSIPMVLLADARMQLDLDYLRDQLWLLVMREPYSISELAAKISRHFAPHAAC
jgi:DNA-binding response OmpR family regulator